jgi:hypothetical protein
MPKLSDVLKSADVRSPVIGNRVVVYHDGAHRIARLNKSGKGDTVTLRIGKATFRDAHSATEAIRATSGSAQRGLDPVEVIRRHLVQDNSKVASHLHGDAFVVTKLKAGGWTHYTAKLTAGGVEVLPTEYGNRGAAYTQVKRMGGVSPTADLSALPSRPIGLYA